MSFNPSVLGGTQAYHQAIVEQLLFDVKGYTQIQRVRQDLISLLQQYSSLSARSAPFARGNASVPLICLSGTIPVNYKNGNYNIPITVYIPENYPYAPPYVFVNPTQAMVITPKHAYVDATCKVSHPYLTAWNPVQELIGLMNVLRQIFSENPPVRSKPANAPPPYPGFGNPAPNGSVLPPYNPLASSINPPQGTSSMPINPVVQGLPPGYNPMGMSTQPGSLSNSQFGQAPPGYSPNNNPSNTNPAQYSTFSPFSTNPFNSIPQPTQPYNPATSPYNSPQQSHGLSHSTSPFTQHQQPQYNPVIPGQNPNVYNQSQQPPPQYAQQPINSNPQYAPYSPQQQQNPQSSPMNSPQQTTYNHPQQQQPPQQSPDDVARAKLTQKLQQKLRDFNENNAKLIEREMIESSNLEETNKLLEHSKSDVLGDKQRQESAVMQLQKQIDDLNRWLEQNDKDEINIDEYTEPKDVLRKQLLHLVAEDMAIEDAQYELNKALFNGQIDLATHVKLTRTLSREQFFKRALIKKIHAVEAGAPTGHM
jgi:ESCRT-I complex subunit TSG101